MYLLTKLAKNKVLVAIVLTLVLGFAFATPAPSSAAACTATDLTACSASQTCVGGLCTDPAGTASDTFGLGGIKTDSGLGDQPLIKTISSIINVSLGLLGIVAVVIVLAGGFKWMTAGGNEEKAGEARKLIFAGVIGLAIILSAFAIAKFVLGNLSKATGTGEGSVTGY